MKPQYVKIGNPFLNAYFGGEFKNEYEKKDVFIMASAGLIGQPRGKIANSLIMYSKIFNVVALIDKNAKGKDTEEIPLLGVKKRVSIFTSTEKALIAYNSQRHKKENTKSKVVFTPQALVLIEPNEEFRDQIEYAILHRIDIINTSFTFLKNDLRYAGLAREYGVRLFDLRDLTHQRASANIKITYKKSKVILVTGTDAGLGIRAAAYEMNLAAQKRGLKSTIYATGQTGLMLGELGTVMDGHLQKFSAGVISHQIVQMSSTPYDFDLIFVEGQSDLFHPTNSSAAMSLLRGSNPDAIVLVHDHSRSQHVGFGEDSDTILYQLTPFESHIKTMEALSYQYEGAPKYKTVAIATREQENIENIEKMTILPVADPRKEGGGDILLDAVLDYFSNYEL